MFTNWKIWMPLLMIIATIGLLFLSGCGTTGKRTDVDLDFTYNITTTGPVTISPNVDQKSMTGAISDLKTDNRPDVPVDLQLTKPADILQGAIADTVDKKILKKAEELKKQDPDIVEPEPIPNQAERIYPKKYHHTLVGGQDGGVSFVTCPGQKLDYAKCTCEGINMPRHGWSKDGTAPPDNRQGWWQMFKEPKANTDIICTTKSGVEHRYKIDKKKVVLKGQCK